MDLKDYKVQPDEGLFEQIEQRLKMRRMVRVWSGVAAVVVVCVAVAAVMMGNPAGKPQGTEGEVVGQATVTENVLQEVTTHQEDIHLRQLQEVKSIQGTAPSSLRGTPSNLGGELLAKTEPNGSSPKFAPLRSQAMSPKEPGRGEVDARRVDGGVCKNETVSRVVPADQTEAASTVDAIAQPIVSLAYTSSDTEGEQPQTEPLPAAKAGEQVVPVHIDDLLWAPNVIVPNGDVDDNRTFKLKFTSAVTDFHVYIYNRGGRQVFTSVDPTFEWDGTHNGTAMPQGAYVWVVKFRDSAGKLQQEKGTVTIIR